MLSIVSSLVALAADDETFDDNVGTCTSLIDDDDDDDDDDVNPASPFNPAVPPIGRCSDHFVTQSRRICSVSLLSLLLSFVGNSLIPSSSTALLL